MQLKAHNIYSYKMIPDNLYHMPLKPKELTWQLKGLKSTAGKSAGKRKKKKK